MAGEQLISVIVPVYNVKPYLERCFESIANQSYRNLEIILVDDGSTDGSGELCDQLAKQDKRATVIHKQNGGLGSARNAGMRVAKGLFFGFVDSDDWILPEMYESLLQKMNSEHAQIAVCGIQRVTEEGTVSYYNDDLRERILFTTEEALKELPKNERLSNSMCNKLFHRCTIAGLWIDETIAYEDNPFTPRCIARAERIVYTAEPFYCYFERQGSISRKRFSAKEFDRVTADKMRLSFYHEAFPQCEDAAAIAYIGTCLKVYYQSAERKDLSEQRAKLEQELRSAIARYPDLPFTKKQKGKAKLFYFSPRLYILSMKLRGK